MPKKAIIIGAGPAGLTAAYELLKRTDIIPVILEKSGDIGGISKTVNYKGNRIDIGGHRFFSKSDRVMDWWLNILPVQASTEEELTVTYQQKQHTIKPKESIKAGSDQSSSEKTMLVRRRLSRIYFLRKFFAYPIQLSFETLRKLGILRTAGIMVSYLIARLFPRKPEKSLQDFMINRFGNKLYLLFFKDYTEKVWGVPCDQISAEWGAQRIKGISIGKAILHAARSLRPTRKKEGTDISQKNTETSLIEKFLYPRLGPGQLWEEVARLVEQKGAEIYMHQEVSAIRSENNQIVAVETTNRETGELTNYEGGYFFSTMPVKELIAGMGDSVPSNVREVASGLQYRDFITVGVLLKKMAVPGNILPDTWIYIQERDVKVGRLQIFNNWSPYMVRDPETVWIGMEYFCNTDDLIWNMKDDDIQGLGISELERMGLATAEDVLDSTVLRMEKTYPAYFGAYTRFDEVRQFTDRFENLFLVGRNGMHKYNNSDHSMLTAMVGVDNIVSGITTKANIWGINTEQEYHEEKATPASADVKAIPAATSPVPSPSIALSTSLPSFKNYLFKTRQNKWYLWIAALAILLQFSVFKYFYPQIGFINGDSYVYLETAYSNLDINTYPTGYSKFLRIFSTFTRSDMLLAAFQYFFLQASALFFLFTLFFFYRPGKLVQVLLLSFFVVNPFFLYIANYVLSDAIFIPLSITWFTLLIWILHRPATRLLVLQAIVLALAFTVRYNALFYPLVGALALLLAKRPLWVKMTSLFGSVSLILLFIFFTSSKYQELSGTRLFSPFTGWQIANNAMYAYRYVDSSQVKPTPARFQRIDKMVRTYFDTTRDVTKHPESMLIASTVYMWDPTSPLQRYMNQQFKKDSTASPLKRWATVAPFYADYGNWLIHNYPATFAEHYLWPNVLKYYAPPVEFLDTYNMGLDNVADMARTWFRFKSNKVTTMTNDFKVSTLNFYPVMVGTLNVVFLLAFLSFYLLDGFRAKPFPVALIWLAGALWVANFAFSVYASPIALRFQIFPFFVFLPVSLLLLEYIWKVAFSSALPPIPIEQKLALK